MTENNAAQPGLTDDEREHLFARYFSHDHPCRRDINALMKDVESALLSKLRAEGVQAGDERAAESHFEDQLESAYWEMDARIKGLGEHKGRPQPDRDAFKWAVRGMRQMPPKTAPERICICCDVPRNNCDCEPESTTLASAPVAGEPRDQQGVSVERLAKDPFLAAQLWRNPVDRAPVAGEAQPPIGFVEPLYLAGRKRGMQWNTKVYATPTEDATAPVYAAPQASEAVPLADCYSNNDGDSWLDCPDDIEFVHGLKVGDEYELKASIWAWPERFRVTKVPDDTSDDYEVEPVSVRSFKTQADKDGGDCAKGAGDGDLHFIAGTIVLHLNGPLDPARVIAASRAIKDWIDRQQRAALPTPSVVKQSLTATQTGEKGESE